MGKRLWVERNKDGSWDAFGEDGAHIKFGKGRGQFTPGDLMKIALAGCAALSSQFAIEHTLGEGKGAKIVVDGTYDADNDAYIGFDEQVVIDATDAGLSDEDAAKLKERVTRHIDKGCTVKHTYVEKTPVRMDVTIKHGRFLFLKKKGDCNAFRSVAIAFLYVPVEFTDDRDRSWFRWLRPHPARPWKPAPPRHP